MKVAERDDGNVGIVLGAEETFWLHNFLDDYGDIREGRVSRDLRDKLWPILRRWIVGAN